MIGLGSDKNALAQSSQAQSGGGINIKRNSHVDCTSVNIRILWRESLSVEKRFNLGNKGANGFNATASHSILNQLLSTNLGSTQLKLF